MFEELKTANHPNPVINEIELHQWQQKKDIVNYCRGHRITMMGFSLKVKGGMIQHFKELLLSKKIKYVN